MTREKLTISPERDRILESNFEHEMITVGSTFAMGNNEKRGIRIESIWKLIRDDKTIDFVKGTLITRFGKNYLMPSEIPDRHKRAIRELGSIVFNVQPFRGLRLYSPLTDNSLTFASRQTPAQLKINQIEEERNQVFIHPHDAELWKIERKDAQLTVKPMDPIDVEYESGLQPTVPEVIRLAHESSLSIRYKYAQLIDQTITGVAAIKRILTLKDRGLNQQHLDYIWSSIHWEGESPLKLDSLLKTLMEVLLY